MILVWVCVSVDLVVSDIVVVMMMDFSMDNFLVEVMWLFDFGEGDVFDEVVLGE